MCPNQFLSISCDYFSLYHYPSRTNSNQLSLIAPEKSTRWREYHTSISLLGSLANVNEWKSVRFLVCVASWGSCVRIYKTAPAVEPSEGLARKTCHTREVLLRFCGFEVILDFGIFGAVIQWKRGWGRIFWFYVSFTWVRLVVNVIAFTIIKHDINFQFFES